MCYRLYEIFHNNQDNAVKFITEYLKLCMISKVNTLPYLSTNDNKFSCNLFLLIALASSSITLSELNLFEYQILFSRSTVRHYILFSSSDSFKLSTLKNLYFFH
jgi:hypothetical protein